MAQILKDFHGLIHFNEAIVYAVVVCVTLVFVNVMRQPYFFLILKIGLQMRVACSGLIFKKLLKTDLWFIEQRASGQVLNLISNDVSRIEESLTFFSYIANGPILILLSVVILARLIDETFLTGFALIVLVIIVQVVLAKVTQRFGWVSASFQGELK